MANYRVPVLETFSWQPPVKDRHLTAPPGGEAKGDRYIVAATATGAWSGQEDKIALCTSTGPTVWSFDTPVKGWTCLVEDETQFYFFNGSAWTLLSVAGTSGYSGYSGISGYSGPQGTTGTSGYSGYSGADGATGTSGYSGYSGPQGTSGYSGISGYSGPQGTTGTSGYSGISGYSGPQGTTGTSGYSGFSGPGATYDAAYGCLIIGA